MNSKVKKRNCKFILSFSLIFGGLFFYLIPSSFFPYNIKFSLQVRPELEINGKIIEENFYSFRTSCVSLSPYIDRGAYISCYIDSSKNFSNVVYGNPSAVLLLHHLNRSSVKLYIHVSYLFSINPDSIGLVKLSEINIESLSYMFKIILIKDGMEAEVYRLELSTSGDNLEFRYLSFDLMQIENKMNITPPYTLICKGGIRYDVSTIVNEYYVESEEISFWDLTIDYNSLRIECYHYALHYPIMDIYVQNRLIKSILDNHVNVIISIIGLLFLLGTLFKYD
ncbi:MAG: hypothetical protein QW743_01800 [Candidatus Methanomethylicia archaeon]